jgi:hypothetical protein
MNLALAVPPDTPSQELGVNPFAHLIYIHDDIQVTVAQNSTQNYLVIFSDGVSGLTLLPSP